MGLNGAVASEMSFESVDVIRQTKMTDNCLSYKLLWPGELKNSSAGERGVTFLQRGAG